MIYTIVWAFFNWGVKTWPIFLQRKNEKLISASIMFLRYMLQTESSLFYRKTYLYFYEILNIWLLILPRDRKRYLIIFWNSYVHQASLFVIHVCSVQEMCTIEFWNTRYDKNCAITTQWKIGTVIIPACNYSGYRQRGGEPEENTRGRRKEVDCQRNNASGITLGCSCDHSPRVK